MCIRDRLKDDETYLNFFESLKSDEPETLVNKVLANSSLWDQDLTAVDGLSDLLTTHFKAIASEQMKEVLLNM
jgi:mannitol-1-phosphate/altronate dehydrogenase